MSEHNRLAIRGKPWGYLGPDKGQEFGLCFVLACA